MQQLRCHRCSAWIGESPGPMELVGIFKNARDRECLPGPRSSWRCKGCGWVNVFEPHPDWRALEVKDRERVDVVAGGG